MSHLDLEVYKLDNGESYVSNCFPVRSFSHQSKEGAGHWQVAPRGNWDERCRVQKSEHLHTSPSTDSPPKKHRKKKNACKTLNAQLLMLLHCVDKPSDLCSVNISEKQLHAVEQEGLEEFVSVAYINASDNCLTLESFSRFSALIELELSVNGLSNMDVCAVNFPRLEILDLSYNSLSNESILAVGLLPRLKVLHLTGNDLLMLPPNMAGPYTDDGGAHQSNSLFQSLEVLMLDDNKLYTSGVFNSLANLKRLKHLNLQGNYISEVPYLQHLSDSELQTSSVQETEDTIMTNYASTGQGFPDTQVNQKESNTNESKGAEVYSENERPPFPQLQYLNLAGNEIVEEEALLAVALFPMLNELIIHSNPLTTHRSGDPPVLTSLLQARLGIKITRKKTADIVKPQLVIPANPKRKVKTKIPKVPKIPLITASTCVSKRLWSDSSNKNDSILPSVHKSKDTLLPRCSQSSSDEREDDDAAAARELEFIERENADISSESLQTDSLFFVTELNELLGAEHLENTDMKEMKKGQKPCPEHLIGYEALLDDNLDLNDYKPVGIQNSVKALEHTLKNLLMYRDSKANLDHLHRPYRGQKKMRCKLMPTELWKPKEEKVKEILNEIKQSKTIKEVPLDKVLQSKDIYRKEYEEGLTLLKEMKMKYKMVRLKAVEQAADIQRISHKKENNSK